MELSFSPSLKNKLEQLKTIFAQFGYKFENDEQLIEFLVDGYLQSLIADNHNHGGCGGHCGCSE